MNDNDLDRLPEQIKQYLLQNPDKLVEYQSADNGAIVYTSREMKKIQRQKKKKEQKMCRKENVSDGVPPS